MCEKQKVNAPLNKSNRESSWNSKEYCDFRATTVRIHKFENIIVYMRKLMFFDSIAAAECGDVCYVNELAENILIL